ncbi:glycosyltransferase [Roseomonas nepalensis]|uniref:Glycosyltransferase n=1 Tax=Muricoccus nepalensis TaxID=1854500 RepID=A0A502FJG5_9PROT|nr:glycosyltransferase [Roseomonas nepalensis]TPG49595.1 glycosyltransferase [Roseomonas nepalensis]
MSEAPDTRARPARGPAGAPRRPAPLVLMLSAAHPPTDLRIVAKEGAALAEAGWRVTHLAPAPLRGAKDVPASLAGVSIVTYPRPTGWIGRLRAARALAARAARLKPDVIHAHEPDSWYAAIRAAGRTGASVVLDVHEHYPSRLDGRLPRVFRGLGRRAVRAACRWMAARADAVVVAKDGLEDAFPEVAIVPVRNYAAAVPVEPREHRPGPLTLVHLGALTRERGAFEMLAALADCPEGTRLSLIGRFTDGCEAEFLAEARRRRLDGRLDRHGWMPHAAALGLAAAEADIGLVLFQPGHENHRLALPHKLFDCMLAGIPVIAPAFAEEVAAVVRETGCGLLVDTADPAAVAGAVRALADPARRASMGAAGRAAALGRYGWAGEAARLVGLYRELAPLPAAAPPRESPAVPIAAVPIAAVPPAEAPADPFAGLPAGGWTPPRERAASAAGAEDAFASLSAALQSATPPPPAGPAPVASPPAVAEPDPFASLSAALRAAAPPPAEAAPPNGAFASLSAALRDEADARAPVEPVPVEPEAAGGSPLPFSLLAGLGEAPGGVPAAPPPVRPAPSPLAGRPIEAPPAAEGRRLLVEAGLSASAMPDSVAALLARPAEEPEAPPAAAPVTSDVPLIEAGLRAAGPASAPSETSAWRLLQAAPSLPDAAAPAAPGR